MSYDSILIDDNPQRIKTLMELLGKHFSFIKIVGIAQDFDEGVLLIEKKKPQLIFLGIILKNTTGFELLDVTDLLDTNVIFMASSEKYALRALKYQPIDYLITPFSLQELKIAINSLIRKSSNGLERPKALVNGHKNRISVLIGNTIRFIDVEEILFCESCGNHSVFHFLNANKIKAKNHIGYFEELLPNDTFFRIHRKYLVNLFHIKSLLRKNGLHCELPNDTFLTVSRRKRDQLLHKVHFRTLSDVTPSK